MPVAITIAQQKGGAGKTTLAAQLGVVWQRAGFRVALVDIDPQGSLMAWHRERRTRIADDDGLQCVGLPGWKLAGALERLRRAVDLVIIDSPPHAETDARVAIRAADVVVVPVQPSPMDLWATRPTLELARKEKVPAFLVFNRMPPRGRLPDAIRRKIEEDGLPLAQSVIGNRVAFAASMMEGKGVVETAPRDAAAQEVFGLADELLTLLKLRMPG